MASFALLRYAFPCFMLFQGFRYQSHCQGKGWKKFVIFVALALQIIIDRKFVGSFCQVSVTRDQQL